HFFKAIEKGKISESIYQIENGFAYKSDTSLDIQFLKRLLAFLSVVSELNRNQKEAILYTLDRIQKKLGDSLNG
ncbi:MAG: hypothetical protein JNK65_08445, partial [Deltaproteobacteria bacterium]|nr:hypothetical protein [Deltaproteobacteria bacterium]